MSEYVTSFRALCEVRQKQVLGEVYWKAGDVGFKLKSSPSPREKSSFMCFIWTSQNWSGCRKVHFALAAPGLWTLLVLSAVCCEIESSSWKVPWKSGVHWKAGTLGVHPNLSPFSQGGVQSLLALSWASLGEGLTWVEWNCCYFNVPIFMFCTFVYFNFLTGFWTSYKSILFLMWLSNQCFC